MDQSALDAMKAFMANETLSQDLSAFENSVNFGLDHIEDWRRQFPDQWVGVYDTELVAISPSLEGLLEALDQAGVPASQAYITFLARERPLLIL